MVTSVILRERPEQDFKRLPRPGWVVWGKIFKLFRPEHDVKNDSQSPGTNAIPKYCVLSEKRVALAA